MAENTDIQEIPQDSKKENLETSKDFIENVLATCTLNDPDMFRRNIGGRKKLADLKNPKKAWVEGKEKTRNDKNRTFEEIVGDLKEYREKSQDWKGNEELKNLKKYQEECLNGNKEDSQKKVPKMVEIFDAGLKTPWGSTEEERQKQLLNSEKITKIRQVGGPKKPLLTQKHPIKFFKHPTKFFKLGTRFNQPLNRAQISAILEDDNSAPIDMRVSGPSRVAKIQATRMINASAQSQNSKNIDAQPTGYYRIPKYQGQGSGMKRETSTGYSPKSRSISPVFEPEEKGQCPMCNQMINLSRLPTHAALCEVTVMYAPE